VTELEAVARKLKVDREHRVQDKLTEWHQQVPESSVSTAAVLEERLRLFMEIKRQTDGDKWFISLEFYYFMDDELDMWKTLLDDS